MTSNATHLHSALGLGQEHYRIVLRVDGPPRGKARPRFARGHTFTDKGTQLAEARVERAWEAAGQPRLPDGPVDIGLEIVMMRPQGHWKRDGSLSAAGARSVWPCKKPDVSNVLKLVEDALNGLAFRDDADICHVQVVRRWANPGEGEHMVVRLRPMPGYVLREAA